MKLLRREFLVTIAYEDTIIEHVAPNKTVTDNAKALISNKLKILAVNILLVQVIQRGRERVGSCYRLFKLNCLCLCLRQ